METAEGGERRREDWCCEEEYAALLGSSPVVVEVGDNAGEKEAQVPLPHEDPRCEGHDEPTVERRKREVGGVDEVRWLHDASDDV